jgi:hypothetical protein
MADVFISYSRRDSELIRALHARLTAEGRDIWVDWKDIPPTADWLEEIKRAIEAADTFVCVLSPDSLTSEICRIECDHALHCSKRIVPVVVRDVETSRVSDALCKLNWLFFRAGEDFEESYQALVETIETDLEWIRAHTRLLVRATEWTTNAKNRSFLLVGSDLEESEHWLANAFNHTPPPTELHAEYVTASRAEETRRQQRQLRGFYLVSLIYGLLQTTISYIVVFDEISEEGLMALSPLWVLGLVFGLFGLTLGKESLRRSVIATGVAGSLLFLFLTIIFPSL